MSRTNFDMLLQAGCHFGHLRRKWNPAMAPYIYTERNGIHIIDLHKTVVKIDEAAEALKQIAKSGKKILFVATKKQTKDVVAEKATSVNMPYVIERWPGGMLTNFPTIRKAVKKMANIDKLMNDGTYSNLSKRELLQVTRQRAKLEKNLGSIADLTRLPSALFVIDICKENIAVKEAQPTDIFVPILLATFFSTLAGIVVTSFYQRINLVNRTMLLTLGGASLLVAGVIWGFSTMSKEQVDLVSTSVANILLMTIIVGFILAGVRKKVNVYDAFIEGAKDGFQTAVRIIPYLVAILVGIGVFRASGAMDWLIGGVKWTVEAAGGNTDFVGALPTALMKPLSGSGARGMMVDAMTTYGADSFVGRLSCIFQGSTDTTFYVLAVYFGSVGIRYTRHAVTCGLLADLAGIIAAIAICYLFFN